jgi:hypothetical protein
MGWIPLRIQVEPNNIISFMTFMNYKAICLRLAKVILLYLKEEMERASEKSFIFYLFIKTKNNIQKLLSSTGHTNQCAIHEGDRHHKASDQ